MRTVGGIILSGALVLSAPMKSAPASPPVPEAVTIIRNNGPASNRVNMVILGDGYTADEMSRYATDVDILVADMFGEPPFANYQSYFNVTRVDVISPESGVSHPERGVSVNSALGAYYNCGGIQRLVCVSISRVNDVLTRSVPSNARDMVLIVVNDAEYGGSGGSVAVVSTHPQAVEIALHEFGHSFGRLADEYTAQPPTCQNTVEPFEPNATRATSRAAIKWNVWIDPATPIPTTGASSAVPGLYEGARYCPTGLYRPTYNSKMRSLGQPFEQINVQHLILRMYNFADPIDLVLPAEAQLSRTCGDSVDFLVEPLEPDLHNLSTAWRVDGALWGTSPTFSLNTVRTGVGTHTVQVEVSDPTAAVKQDPAQLLRSTRQWTVTVNPPPAPAILGFPEKGCTVPIGAPEAAR